MIITHTQDSDGNVRIYLGGYASMEIWVEPKDDDTGWSLHADEGVSAYGLDDYDKRHCAVHALKKLSDLLNVAYDDLQAVPFEKIAALHNQNPYESRRGATPKRTARKHTYIATDPEITRPASDFSHDEYDHYRRHRR